MSLNLNPAYVGSHWESVELGAARTGRTPKRADWRLVREVFIADTDAEAMRLSAGGMMGRMMKEYFLPLLASFQFTEYLKHKPDVPDSDVTPSTARVTTGWWAHRPRWPRSSTGSTKRSGGSAPCC